MKLHSADLDWITPDAEKVIARHARVSTKDPDREEYEKLLTYCIKHGHWSVFEQASASFEVSTTRAISPQILRHRSFVFQELSQRYCAPNETLEIDEKPFQFELRFQASKNRQSSSNRLPLYLCESFWERLEILDSQTQSLYNEMIEAGVARECARNILPLYTPTRLHMSGTIRSFIHYVGLRGKEDTQLEHREIARSIGYRLGRELPVVIKAVKESGDKSLEGWDFLRYLPQ
jgi:thymidylate synthase (FAD)